MDGGGFAVIEEGASYRRLGIWSQCFNQLSSAQVQIGAHFCLERFFAMLQRGVRGNSRTRGGISALFGSVGTLFSQAHIAQHQEIGHNASHNEQSRNENQHRIKPKLLAVVASLVFLFLRLLSFYFAQSSIDEEALVNVWRL